jgi:hypothetical protein
MAKLKIDKAKLRRLFLAFKEPEIEEDLIKALKYTIEFTTGDVLYAEGEHADVLLRYLEECQHVASSNCLALYTGPGLKKYTAEEWKEFNNKKVDV